LSNIKHGMHNTHFYQVWADMKTRCSNDNSSQYHYYGGRGIAVCTWWYSFENFRDDLYDSYLSHVEVYGRDNTSIDRIDVDGDYKPDNVRWTTKQEQARNRRIQSNNNSGCVGVNYRESNAKWRAYICVNRKHITLGTFSTKEEAIRARKEAEEKYFNNKEAI
jgi:hypothetical protein